MAAVVQWSAFAHVGRVSSARHRAAIAVDEPRDRPARPGGCGTDVAQKSHAALVVESLAPKDPCIEVVREARVQEPRGLREAGRRIPCAAQIGAAAERASRRRLAPATPLQRNNELVLVPRRAAAIVENGRRAIEACSAFAVNDVTMIRVVATGWFWPEDKEGAREYNHQRHHARRERHCVFGKIFGQRGPNERPGHLPPSPKAPTSRLRVPATAPSSNRV